MSVEVQALFFGHSWEMILILALALLIFGPGKLPDVGQALGRGLRDFRAALRDPNEDAGQR